MSSPSTTDTKSRLLDAAEALYAEGGAAALNLRRLTSMAEANLAAVQYHFGGKEALVAAMFARRIEPMNEERLRLLEAVDPGAGDAALPVVLHAFAAPCFALLGGDDAARVARLMARVMGDPDLHLQVVERHFAVVVAAFSAALARCLPDRDEAAISRLFVHLLGSMAQSLMAPHILPRQFGRHPLPAQQALEDFISYHLAAIRGTGSGR